MNSELAEKTGRLVRMLEAENYGGVLLNAQHNFAWLTGGKSNGVNSSAENGACFLLVRRDGKRFVLANNIEMPRLLAEEISAEDFEPIEFAWEAEKMSGDCVIEKAKSVLAKNSASASDLFLSAEIKPVENLIARCRFQLTAPEIKRYRRLGRDSAQAFKDLFDDLRAGATEIEIARKIKDSLAKYNIHPVVTLIGADARIEKFRHPLPTENSWRKILLVAVCGRRDGLIANLSRLVCIGEIPDELKRKTEAVSRVHTKILSALEPEISGRQLYQILQTAYADQGFGEEIHQHHQGGATGYKTRDWLAHPASMETVKFNQAFAWNPSITGTKSEETILFGENGVEVLTASTGFPAITIELGDQSFKVPGILQL